MPRPRINRRVRFRPDVTYFKPAGVRIVDLDEIVLTVDEYESVRLVDLEGIEQSEAGKKMKISQSTFSRLLKSARKKISDAVVNGKAIKIEGGSYEMVQPRGRGLGQGGRGRMGGFGAGPGGVCKCTKCNHEEPQVRGQPCMNKKCPKCGAQMTRG